MPDTEYINVDELSSPSFYYDGNDHIVVNNPTAYNPFSGILDIDKAVAEVTPVATPEQLLIIGDPSAPLFSFGADAIISISSDISVNIIGDELNTDVMDMEVIYNDTNGDLRALPWATPIYYYYGSNLEGRFYSTDVIRTGVQRYRIRSTSAAGILEHEKFYGGMYDSEEFHQLVEWIVGSNGLQPLGGIYRKCSRETTTTSLSGWAMGDYDKPDGTQSGVSGTGKCFLTATMSSKLYAKVKILGYIGNASGTTATCAILGCANPFYSSSTEALKYQYGLYMRMTRANTSVSFPTFGEVFFIYGGTTISLGTPTSSDNAVYELEIDPNAGTAKINGTTHTITKDNSVANNRAPLHVYGGGCTTGYSSSTGVYSLLSSHNCEFEVYYYQIRSSSNVLQADYVAVEDLYTGGIGVLDLVSHTLLNNRTKISVNQEDLTPYDSTTYGEFPLFNNRTAFQQDVLDHISYSAGIESLHITGWLPICSKREALHQLLFATGVILIKNADGGIMFVAPSAEQESSINEDKIYENGSEEQPEHTNAIELTEHGYVLDTSAATETIYENTEGSAGENYIAPYNNAPASYTSGSGITHIYSNCNAALVSGTGTLTGRPYQHSKTVLQREIANYPDGRVLSIADATLVTLRNSGNVLDRLAAYYGNAKQYKVDIVQEGQRCGLFYGMRSVFGDLISGFLVKASKVVSTIIKSSCIFTIGYNPPPVEDTIERYEILTGSGTWNVPASVLAKTNPRIKVVLVGGGQGGSSGYAGANGIKPSADVGTTAAEGGNYGASGNGGKTLEVTIDNPSSSYSYSCGSGGAGGAKSTSHTTSNAGSNGGNTTFGSYSSASGTTGVIYNAITGDKYAGSMIRSNNQMSLLYAGGGDGGYHTTDGGILYHAAEICMNLIENVGYDVWSAGEEGARYMSGGYIYASGGCGGGAGYGQNGSSGTAASYTNNTYRSGNGGKGGDATATPPKATDFNSKYYGYGGLGGGGGGGGGNGGWVTSYGTSVAGNGGSGGYGGVGGAGGDGCVIVYY